MVESALLGDPPLTSRDELIRHAMIRYRTNFNGNPKLPFGPHRPAPPLPDLANESNAWRTKTAAAFFLTALIVVTLGRFPFRWQRRREQPFGWDDVLVVPAAAVAAAYVGHILSAFPDGVCLGKHMWFCTYEDIERLYLTFTIGQTIFYFSVYCAKISLLFFIRRLTLSTISPMFRWAHRILFVFLLCCGLISLLGTAFQCTPVWARWSFVTLAEVHESDYKCIDALKFQTGLRAMHITTDLLLLMYPAFIIRTLQMKMVKKIGLIIIFSFGTLSVICSIVRNIIFGKKRPDYTYLAHDVYIWNMADITSACIVASLPAYYPLFSFTFKGIRRALGISTQPARPVTPESDHTKSAASKSTYPLPDRPTTTSEGLERRDTASDDESMGSGERRLVMPAVKPGTNAPGTDGQTGPQGNRWVKKAITVRERPEPKQSA